MLSIKAGILVGLLSIALNGVPACDAKKSGGVQNSNQAGNAGAPVNRQPEQRDEAGASVDVKTLVQGQHSRVSNAFIAVARDAETYAALRSLIPNLPETDKDFFKSNLVVAAFLGERRTGGFNVRFRRAVDGSIRIEETTPPKGSMSVQVITTPFSVAAVPVKTEDSVAVDAGDAWRAMARPYRVTEGEFAMSGGITGRTEKFGLTGSLGVMREGNLATLLFDLQSKDGAKRRALKDAASGIVQSDGRIRITHLGAGTLVDQPADALSATGMFAENEGRLSLTFESIPGQVRDGYNGTGNLKAEAASPAPQKKQPSTEDAPQ